jgi:hypothetical protein
MTFGGGMHSSASHVFIGSPKARKTAFFNPEAWETFSTRQARPEWD